MVLQGSKDPGSQYVSRTMNHRVAYVRPCEWPTEEFMVKAGIKDEFDAYVRNADLEDFV